MCKTYQKARNDIISLLHDKLSRRSQENRICRNELIVDFSRQNETKYM